MNLLGCSIYVNEELPLRTHPLYATQELLFSKVKGSTKQEEEDKEGKERRWEAKFIVHGETFLFFKEVCSHKFLAKLEGAYLDYSE
jgi:hypothetical protein